MSKKVPSLSKKDVEHVAKLAKLPLTPKEITKFQKQLSQILDHIKLLQELPTDKVEPTSQVTGLENVTRPDETKDDDSLSSHEALSNSPQTHQGFFKVKGVFDPE